MAVNGLACTMNGESVKSTPKERIARFSIADAHRLKLVGLGSSWRDFISRMLCRRSIVSGKIWLHIAIKSFCHAVDTIHYTEGRREVNRLRWGMGIAEKACQSVK